ncbi:hypothetical protein PGT21_006857 [Puccinia graminis f. sp. tritici]|uniref:Uncharacterized protein n=1 Tax=Puccinia graminis f. sp. tritici TaxID=56615 RepID=A0A5B0Q5F6_PUCGR|nr:hypothetical protein PGT21_006857 [Puccinia graminis f. sp. tritici]
MVLYLYAMILMRARPSHPRHDRPLAESPVCSGLSDGLSGPRGPASDSADALFDSSANRSANHDSMSVIPSVHSRDPDSSLAILLGKMFKNVDLSEIHGWPKSVPRTMSHGT